MDDWIWGLGEIHQFSKVCIWDVSKNRGTPKWMVKIMKHPIKMNDLGGNPTIFGNTRIVLWEMDGNGSYNRQL